ncbi:DEAD/DEAH box helicase [Rufibacter sp. LB8]|uniref:DEAD/DEAH box helicase n=1 Tax=Rufibacter sp. LB8 TaxID=2777781 RepID=UPI00178C3EB5|nr:DEAD/DEAH box helicase [Rufibacter sp. LB8]
MTEPEQTAPHAQYHPNNYLLPGVSVATLTYATIARHSSGEAMVGGTVGFDLQPVVLELNRAVISGTSPYGRYPEVQVEQKPEGLWVSCGCVALKIGLCGHQAQVLQTVLNRQEIRVFFDAALRREKLKPVAQEYGLAQEPNLDRYFKVAYVNKALEIKPRLPQLLPVTAQSQALLKEKLAPAQPLPFLSSKSTETTGTQQILVLSEHKYYKHFTVELYTAATTQNGKVKNPLTLLSPVDFIWQTDQPQELKFYSAVARFQNNYDGAEASAADLQALQALVANPKKLPVYHHLPEVSANITASSVQAVQVLHVPLELVLEVQAQDDFYSITGLLYLEQQPYLLKHLSLKYGHFLQLENRLYLLHNPDVRRVLDFFQKRSFHLLIHASKLQEFKENVLANLEARIKISYAYLKPATTKQLTEQGFDGEREQIIYLSDSEDFILLTPVMRYGHVEVPVLSYKQIHATDAKGHSFTVHRDREAELQLTAAIVQQHPHFKEQLHLDSFYLHKDRFLAQDWFLHAFEAWRNKKITLLGFKDLKQTKLSPHKATISMLVTSGINWFDTSLNVQFGNQKAALKHLHRALRKKSRFVTLDDGTQGILPEEWLERLQKLFSAAEVVGEKLRTPKVNFAQLEELYDQEVLSPEVRKEVALYHQTLAQQDGIPEVEVPAELQTTLRDYQRQGLNWLCFLDQFTFGGCLADDMGLGKTVQVLAFFLVQQQRHPHTTNLVVVPTSLLFNWQEEIQKFAPTLKVMTSYGKNRVKHPQEIAGFDVVLTTYGTLLSDSMVLKNCPFNYVVLDESQAIKNPESERYQAARLLQARNRLVLTGTPLENNTYDLYGQLSFAVPGLLGSKRHFRDHYSKPIDQFKDSRRAKELQRKIKPFLLRRTKEQVAQELPDKTEMVLYCEMGQDQRKIYAAHELEIREFISAQGEDEIQKSPMHVLRGLTRLRQICNSPALLPEEAAYGEASAKLDVLLEQIESKAPHHKILVFSQFVSMLTLIQAELVKRGISYSLLTGQTKDRMGAVAKFQEQEDVRVFLISLKAGGTGLNLTRADYVYLVDPWWNPAVENQAIDRTYRIGQTKNVVAVRLICPGTVEEKIMKLQASKKELVHDLIKTDGGVLNGFSKQELLALLG